MSICQSITKPAKPYPEFPLFAHSRGYWCKKFKGKQYNCGRWYDDDGSSNHVAALAQWKEIRNRLELGDAPKQKRGALTTDLLVNLFLDAKGAKVDTDDLSPSTFNQYKLACAWIKKNLGAHRLIETLQPSDFTSLRKKFPKGWKTKTITHQINNTRMVFKWAYDTGLIDRPIRYGDNFSRPSMRRVMAERAKSNKKQFTYKEFWTLYKHASVQVRAWMLLGLNCGYGNSDLSRLTVKQASGEWLDAIRGKTSEDRRCWLWPETRRAIKAVLQDHDGGDLLFRTRHGQCLVEEDGTRDAVAGEFKKLREATKIDRKGVGFYCLRHMTLTIGEQCPEVPNVKIITGHVMGHRDGSMAGHYRESIPDASIKKVCQYIRKTIMAAKPKTVKI